MSGKQPIETLLLIIAAISFTNCEGNETAEIAPAYTETLIAEQPVEEIPTPTKTEETIQRPTLTVLEREALFQDLLQTNAGCQLPCWWGISPGETTWTEANDLLHSYGSEIQKDIEYGNSISKFGLYGFNFKAYGQHNFSVYEKDNQVLGITIQASDYTNPDELKELWDRYAPENFFLSESSPSRIWIRIFSRDDEVIPYSIWLFYDEIGTLIIYEGVVDINSSNYMICPSFKYEGNLNASLLIYLIDTDEFQSLEEFFEFTSSPIIYEATKPLSNAIGISIQEFSERLLSTEDAFCFETLQEIWP